MALPWAPGIRRMAGTGMGGDYRIASRFAPFATPQRPIIPMNPHPWDDRRIYPQDEFGGRRFDEPDPMHMGRDPIFLKDRFGPPPSGPPGFAVPPGFGHISRPY